MKKSFFLVPLLMLGVCAFAQKNVDKTDTVERIFTSIESPAEFPGGMTALTKYLSANIRYPASARANNVEGKVIMRFVVCKDGSLCDETIMRSADTSMSREVMRVVKAMPQWKPGKQNGEPVKVYYTLPVTFKLPKTDTTQHPVSAPLKEHSDLPDASDYLLNKEKPKEVETEDKIITAMENAPEFPGGTKALLRYLSDNLQKPAEAKKNKIHGRVIVQFVVDKNGDIINSVIKKIFRLRL